MLPILTVAVIALLIAADQVIKIIVLNNLAPVGSIVVIDKFISLTYVENTGAAFGSFHGYTAVLSVFTALVLAVGLIYLLSGKIKSKIAYWAAAVVIAGGTGNLIDRIFRGYVIDFIEPLFVKFAVFNFADILVTVGAFVLIFYLIYEMFKESKDSKKEGAKDE
ncbi:MAG: signal peptidase II [Ruminococcaceae bacterium]|nr:signal peptidase II [Oscillospiraceae bacterium]